MPESVGFEASNGQTSQDDVETSTRYTENADRGSEANRSETELNLASLNPTMQQALHGLSRLIESKPWLVIGSAAAAGLLAGLVLKPTRQS